MNISLNPNYVLKKDDGCVLLLPKKGLADNDNFDDTINAVIHPLHAQILSFINGYSYSETINNICYQLKLSQKKVKHFIDNLIENKKQIGFNYKGVFLAFPINTIIKSNYKRQPSYTPSDFEYNYLDLRTKRHKTPSTLTLMINNICITNCIYCYADKRIKRDCIIPLARIKQIIQEAKKIGVVNFDLIGGEVFLYKDWKTIVNCFISNGFNPFLSTKYPITEDDIKFLAKIKIPFIQFSLDTLIPNHISKLLGVGNDYIKKISRTFELFQKYNVEIIVHSIITNINDNPEDMLSLFDFLKKFKNIRYWLPEVAGPSIYAKINDYNMFKADKQKIATLQKTIDFLIKNSTFKIINGFQKVSFKEGERTEVDKMKSFLNRGICSGNFSHMYILPTGDVTICEELYWNKRFIIGNIINQSLKEVWESKSAKNLFELKQCEIPSESPCSTCENFVECREVRGICYRDTIKAYGEDKWYFPDVNCPKAPQPYNSIEI